VRTSALLDFCLLSTNGARNFLCVGLTGVSGRGIVRKTVSYCLKELWVLKRKM